MNRSASLLGAAMGGDQEAAAGSQGQVIGFLKQFEKGGCKQIPKKLRRIATESPDEWRPLKVALLDSRQGTGPGDSSLSTVQPSLEVRRKLLRLMHEEV